MFKKILVPTDGSEFSEKVVKDGMALAATVKAAVTGVHVIPSYYLNPFVEFGPSWSDDQLQKQLRVVARAEGNKYLDRIEASAVAMGVPFDRIIVENESPWKGIIDAAQQKNCDLIMMAAHGRRGLSALVLGSETNKVLTHSKIPVLVYR